MRVISRHLHNLMVVWERWEHTELGVRRFLVT